MSPRPRSVSDADVLTATGRAISRVGPVRLTLADVAREAGIAPPTLVQRFGSKRGLLLAFAAGGTERVEAAFARARAGRDAPVPALIETLSGLAGALRSREALVNHLAFLQMDLADREFHRHAVAHGEAMRAGIAGLLEEAVRRGELAVGGPAAGNGLASDEGAGSGIAADSAANSGTGTGRNGGSGSGAGMAPGSCADSAVPGGATVGARGGVPGTGTESVSRLADAVQSMYNGALITWAVHGGGTVRQAVRRALEALLAPYRIAP